MNEHLLMQMDWSPDLKLACYDLQNIRPATDAEIIRDTAQVLEDVLQTVCGERKTYPYSNVSLKKPRVIKPTGAETKEQLEALRRQKQEEMERQREEHERQEKQKELLRIKHSILLKEKILKKKNDDLLKAPSNNKDLLTKDLREIASKGALPVLKAELEREDPKALIKK